VSHARRAPLAARFPVHATLTARRGLRSLRGKAEYAALRAAFAAGCDRFGFRLVHYSVQRDHLHVLVEAKDEGQGRALARHARAAGARGAGAQPCLGGARAACSPIGTTTTS
jgi:REP element-mobilizing transposase RayT